MKVTMVRVAHNPASSGPLLALAPYEGWIDSSEVSSVVPAFDVDKFPDGAAACVYMKNGVVHYLPGSVEEVIARLGLPK